MNHHKGHGSVIGGAWPPEGVPDRDAGQDVSAACAGNQPPGEEPCHPGIRIADMMRPATVDLRSASVRTMPPAGTECA